MADKTPLQERAESMEKILEMIEGAKLHKKLASGYESTGAYDSEQRELIRGIYLQNEALGLMLTLIGEALNA